MATVIDQQTQTFVVSDLAPTPTEEFGISGATLQVSPPTMYVSGANLPEKSQSRSTTRETGRGQRAFQLGGAGALRDLEATAFDAAQALREWYAHARAQREAGRGPDVEFVRACVKRAVNDEVEIDGVAAWVLLDGDKPSHRTVSEYRGTVRDALIWLAERGICPAETGAEDMKAYKAWMQADGAPEQMELLRARWYGREPRLTYELDWRGVAGMAAVRGYAEARREADKAQRALNGCDRRQARALSKLADRAAEVAGWWLASILVALASYADTPRRLRFERYSADTVALRITLTRNWWKMAQARQAVFENPLLGMKVGKRGDSRAQHIISRFYSDEELLSALALCDENRVRAPRLKAKAARDTAMIKLMRNQGLRVSEIVALDMDDLNVMAGENGTLTLRHAKGDKTRTVLLAPKARAALDRWMMYRRQIAPMTSAVFVSLNAGARPDARQPHDRLDVRAVRAMWDELQRRAGIKRAGRSVHGLRHAYATRAMMEDQSALVSLSLSMGHSSVTITQGYVEAAQLMEKNPAKLAEI